MIITSSSTLPSSDAFNGLSKPLIFERPTRTARGYPTRFSVSPHQRIWEKPCPEYSPPFYESPRLKEQDRTKRPGGWADPADVSKEEFLRWSKIGYMRSFEGPIQHDEFTGRPLNPMGRVGIQGRGVLGKWGPNHAADAIVTRVGPSSGRLEVILVQRRSGEWALPGGMIDDGETSLTAAIRELGEEAQVWLEDQDGHVVFRGIGDGPRVTDNAWIETTAYHFHLGETSSIRQVTPAPSDEVFDARWEVITPNLLESLYANHGEILASALQQFRLSKAVLPELVNGQIEGLPHSPLLTSLSSLRGRIGILGGTFDPIHKGHLAIAEKAKLCLDLDAVVFIPTSQNPLKGDGPKATPRERVEMAMYALKDSPHCYVSPMEVFERGTSYSIDTVRKITAEIGNSDHQLFMLIGADCLRDLPKWKEIRELTNLCAFVPISRGGESDLISDTQLCTTLKNSLGEKVVSHMIANSITRDVLGGSATEMRDSYSEGNFDYPLALPEVSQYVISHRTYEKIER
jgi:ADP-ribose pyrophosphatase